jgi:hypothetical protein
MVIADPLQVTLVTEAGFGGAVGAERIGVPGLPAASSWQRSILSRMNSTSPHRSA